MVTFSKVTRLQRTKNRNRVIINLTVNDIQSFQRPLSGKHTPKWAANELIGLNFGGQTRWKLNIFKKVKILTWAKIISLLFSLQVLVK